MTGKLIAANIRAERNRNNITADETAKTLNISRQTYYKYENDASKISAETLVKLSNLFNCSVEDFFIQK